MNRGQILKMKAELEGQIADLTTRVEALEKGKGAKAPAKPKAPAKTKAANGSGAKSGAKTTARNTKRPASGASA